MKLAWKKDGDEIVLGAHCQGPCSLWMKAAIPVPGALGFALRILPDGQAEELEFEGFYRGCSNLETCPHVRRALTPGEDHGTELGSGS